MKTKLTTAWFCATSKLAEEWQFAGASVEDAEKLGRDLFGKDFFVAPGHPATASEEADGNEHDYTVEVEHARLVA